MFLRWFIEEDNLKRDIRAEILGNVYLERQFWVVWGKKMLTRRVFWGNSWEGTVWISPLVVILDRVRVKNNVEKKVLFERKCREEHIGMILENKIVWEENFRRQVWENHVWEESSWDDVVWEACLCGEQIVQVRVVTNIIEMNISKGLCLCRRC